MFAGGKGDSSTSMICNEGVEGREGARIKKERNDCELRAGGGRDAASTVGI